MTPPLVAEHRELHGGIGRVAQGERAVERHRQRARSVAVQTQRGHADGDVQHAAVALLDDAWSDVGHAMTGMEITHGRRSVRGGKVRIARWVSGSGSWAEKASTRSPQASMRRWGIGSGIAVSRVRQASLAGS